MTLEEKLYYPVIAPVVEASGTTALIAAGGGSENFSLQNWAFPLLIVNIKVVGSVVVTPFTFSIFENQARAANDLVYRITGATTRIDDNLVRDLPFRVAVKNADPIFGSVGTQSPFWCTITNNDVAVAATFYVQIRYRVQGGPIENNVRGTIPHLTAPLTDGV